MKTSREQIIFLTVIFSIASGDRENVTPLLEECPSNCTCQLTSNRLAIDCYRGVFESQIRLSNQIDKLLSKTMTVANLTILIIANTPLTDLPRSVCNLTQLFTLQLSRNRLSRLPDNCLSRMKNLKFFRAEYNNITELQDGLFDDLRKMQEILLQNNNIAAIGPRVFLNMNNRVIKTVNLSRNSLQTLDAWPFSLGLNQSKEARWITLYFDHNNISSSSNDIGWQLNRTVAPLHMKLLLRHNNVLHFTDMLHGWNITNEDLLFLIKTHHRKLNVTLILHLELQGNPLDCNCKDFCLFKAGRNTSAYNELYQNAICASPKNLENRRVDEIDLNLFVCNVTEQCPPLCHCVYQPSNRTMHVNCANTSMSETPRKLPVLPDVSARYRLNFSHNPLLQQFVAEPYLVNVSLLYADRCAINKITEASWIALLRTPIMFLSDNRLHSLPKDLEKFNVTSTHIFLGYNPWKCSCESSWMKAWLLDKPNVFIDMLKMFCRTPERLHDKSITQIPEEDFCSDPFERLTKRIIIISSICCGAAVILVMTVCFAAHQLKYRMFARWGFHPFDRDECNGEEMDYDVFLSCSSEDRDEADSLVTRLESSGYKVCFHERDFEGGQTIENNMSRAVTRSRRTVCLITSHFIRRFLKL